MRLNILWCTICQAVTAWHLKGLINQVWSCDRCFHNTKGEDVVADIIKDLAAAGEVNAQARREVAAR